MVFGSGLIQAFTIGHGTKYKEIIVPKNNKILIIRIDIFFVILSYVQAVFKISHNGQVYANVGDCGLQTYQAAKS